MAEIKHINEVLKMALFIPDYQRPYKWSNRNIADLLGDIDIAISDAGKHPNFKYRIGTVILNKVGAKNKEMFGIVDGQQRILSLVLLQMFVDDSFACELLNTKFTSKISQMNLHNNYRFIKDWFALKTEEYKEKVKAALSAILEVVILTVDKEAEAFQLFDSQNTRGRELDPHDLLKAYHLREMKSYPYEMQHAVTKWEAVSTRKIRELFELYLFPIRQWASCAKSFSFSAKDIDTYKGIDENSPYSYAKRASKAMPYFQIAESFIAGNDFFEMVAHYLKLLSDVEIEITTSTKFSELASVIENKANNAAGFRYAKNLFYCAVLCYYDRFRNFDKQVIKKLFTWAFMLRVDMINLGFDSINKYAIGEYEYRYSNNVAMFSIINNARLHTEIANMQIVVLKEPDNPAHNKWDNLYRMLKRLNGYSDSQGRRR